MKKLGIVSIDLAAMVGSLQFKCGPQLPRGNKPALEMAVATAFVKAFATHTGITVTSLRPNDADPPDLFLELAGRTVGLELTELLPANRLWKDAQIRQLRRETLSEMHLGPESQDHAVHISLCDDYATRLQSKGLARFLARLLDSALLQEHGDELRIPVPGDLQDVVRLILVQRVDLQGDPRIQERREPLIVFSAQHTLVVPEDDCPAIATAALERKRRQHAALPTWLILWSNDQSLSTFRNELDYAIGRALQGTPISFEKVFHVHLFPHGGITEFPLPSPDSASA